MFDLKMATLNINGINEKGKQIKLVEYIKKYGFHIVAIQEHNINLTSKLQYLDTFYHIIQNK